MKRMSLFIVIISLLMITACGGGGGGGNGSHPTQAVVKLSTAGTGTIGIVQVRPLTIPFPISL